MATFYHFALGREAPYPLASAPVLLGTAGGIGLLIGPAGLSVAESASRSAARRPAQAPMDRGFIVLLLIVSLTGFALLAWRDTGAMALLLACTSER